MNFDSVNVASLKNAINSCKSSIDYSKSEQIISDIASNSVWNAKSKENFSKALNKLINEKYKKLEKKLDECMQLAGGIEKHKHETAELKKMQAQLVTLTNSDSSNADAIAKLKTAIKDKENKIATIKGSINSLV